MYLKGTCLLKTTYKQTQFFLERHLPIHEIYALPSSPVRTSVGPELRRETRKLKLRAVQTLNVRA